MLNLYQQKKIKDVMQIFASEHYLHKYSQLTFFNFDF